MESDRAAAPMEGTTGSYPMYPFHMVYSVPNAQALMLHAAATKDHPYLASMLANPMLAGKGATPATDDQQQPTYVNPKQYHRIMARRKARARLEAHRKIMAARKPFLHKSRHEHACRRPRGKGGRFLTKEELAAEQAKQQEEGGQGIGDEEDEEEGGSRDQEGASQTGHEEDAQAANEYRRRPQNLVQDGPSAKKQRAY